MSGSVLRPLTARQELEALRRSPALLPMLMKSGLGVEDATALAGNACMAWLALGEERPARPEQILEQFSLGEIAALCEQIANESGEVAR